MVIEIREFRPGDEDMVLAFHNRAFPGHPPRSRAHFDWKFLRNPGGPPELALAVDGERCVAAYGALPVRCLLRGEVVRAGLHTDVAIAPDARLGLGGSRALVAVGREYARRFASGVQPLGWGFPEPPLQRLAIRFLRFGILRDVCWIVQSAARVAARPRIAGGPEVTAVREIPVAVGDLWRQCAAEVGAATVRDAPYLEWRYLSHPDVNYVVLEARADATLRGLAIFRAGGPDARLLTVMEWMVPAGDEETERALLHRLGDEALDRGLPYVGVWLPLDLPIARRWQEEHGFFAHGSPHQEVYRAWGTGLGRRWLAEHWYQTTGDIEFY